LQPSRPIRQNLNYEKEILNKMKKQTENELEAIIRNYGSLEAYNEEQRRCALFTIETKMRANPFTNRIKFDNASPLEAPQNRQPRRSFWLKFFTQKA
jgi:hypothetical protein